MKLTRQQIDLFVEELRRTASSWERYGNTDNTDRDIREDLQVIARNCNAS